MKKQDFFEDVFYLQVFVRLFCLVAKAYENVTLKRVENIASILRRGWLKPVRLCLKSHLDYSVQRQKAQTAGENVVVSNVFSINLKLSSLNVKQPLAHVFKKGTTRKRRKIAIRFFPGTSHSR